MDQVLNQEVVKREFFSAACDTKATVEGVSDRRENKVQECEYQRNYTAEASMDIGKKTLGVVGGGQLGRMMAWPAHRMGVKLVCLDAAGATSPCAQVHTRPMCKGCNAVSDHSVNISALRANEQKSRDTNSFR